METEHLDSCHSQKSQEEKKLVYIYSYKEFYLLCKEKVIWLLRKVLGSIKAIHFAILAPVLLRD